MKILKPFVFLTTALLLTVAVGCRDASDSHGHSHAGGDAHSHEAENSHDHAPPHGGTPVVVADDQFHLELVHDPTAGRMQAYVLDGHLEGYVQVSETSFGMVAKAAGKDELLTFRRAPESTSGNVPEKSSLFEAQAEWLKSAREFEGHIPALTLNGARFTNISFSFPKGSKHVH
ncbi:MAG: hypothetical protein ACYDC1_07465 [Limisphaerales bacterium]